MVLRGEASSGESVVDLGQNVEVRWHPFQLNPEMPVEGLTRDCTGRQSSGVGNSRNGSMHRWPLRERRSESNFAMT